MAKRTTKPSQRELEANTKRDEESNKKAEAVQAERLDELSKVRIICVRALPRGGGRPAHLPGEDVTAEAITWANTPSLIKSGTLKTEPPTDYMKFFTWTLAEKKRLQQLHSEAMEKPITEKPAHPDSVVTDEPKSESAGEDDPSLDDATDGEPYDDDSDEARKEAEQVSAANVMIGKMKALTDDDSARHIKSVLEEVGLTVHGHTKAELLKQRDEWLEKIAN